MEVTLCDFQILRYFATFALALLEHWGHVRNTGYPTGDATWRERLSYLSHQPIRQVMWSHEGSLARTAEVPPTQSQCPESWEITTCCLKSKVF